MTDKARYKIREVYKLRLEAASFAPFHGKCYVCHRKSIIGKKFTFHHLWYGDNDKKYSDFDDQLEYTKYLVTRVNANPKQFLFVCNAHHQSIEKLKRFKTENLERLIMAVRMSKKLEVLA